MSRRLMIKGCLAAVLGLLALVLLATALVWFQARRPPEGRPEYVALGSSFAAGAGLGRLQQDSPLLCARSVNGYPGRLARTRGLSLVDMSCGGALTRHLLRGGQVFQGPQIRAITRETRLVTITVGGNDIGYVGDLSLLASRKSDTPVGWLARSFWKGPKSPAARDDDGLRRELLSTLRAIHARAPDARIVLATYPTILPPSGTCDRLQLTEAEVRLMREVGDQLAAVTRSAAEQGGALLVDMNALGAAHHACASAPWTTAWVDAGPAPFHPTRRGAAATAEAVSDALSRPPSAP